MNRLVFSQPIFYLRRETAAHSRGKQWAFFFHAPDGQVLLEGRFPEIPGEAILFHPGQEQTPALRLKARPRFWWHGRYDVIDGSTGSVLGTLRRTGGIENGHGRQIARVGNATPFHKSLLQLVGIGILHALFAEGNDPTALGIDRFQLRSGKTTVGFLRRVRLPFALSAKNTPPPPRTFPARCVRRIGNALCRKARRGGWQLDFSPDTEGLLRPELRLAAALFSIQIEERYA